MCQIQAEWSMSELLDQIRSRHYSSFTKVLPTPIHIKIFVKIYQPNILSLLGIKEDADFQKE